VRRAASSFNFKRVRQDGPKIYLPSLRIIQRTLPPRMFCCRCREALNLANRSSEFDKYLASRRKTFLMPKELRTNRLRSSEDLYFDQQYASAIKELRHLHYLLSAKFEICLRLILSGGIVLSLERCKEPGRCITNWNTDRSFQWLARWQVRIAELEFKQAHYDKAIPFLSNSG